MVAVMVLVALVVSIWIVGEWADARSQRRLGICGPVFDPRGSRLPEPLVPSTIQRSSGGG